MHSFESLDRSHIVVHVLIGTSSRRLNMADTAGVPIAHLLQNVLIGCRWRVLAKDPRVLLDLLAA